MLCIKFQVPGSRVSLVLIQTKGVTDSKGNSSANVLWISVKSHLNMDPEGRRDSDQKKNKINNRYLLIFCAHAQNKISTSWLKSFSSFNANKSTASGAKCARSSVIFPHRMAFVRGG